MSLAGSMQQPPPPRPQVYHIACQRPRSGWRPTYERILLVDDMPRYTQSFLETLCAFYEEGNLTIHVAHTFADGLTVFQENEIQLVVLDVDLNDPEGGGEELMTAMQTHNPQVVIMANSSEQRYNDILLHKGAVTALYKESRKFRRWLKDNGWTRTGPANQALAKP